MEYPQAFQSTKRKARKEHRCCECLGTIRKGETYTYVSGIWDSRPSDYKTCPDCTLLRFQIDLTTGPDWEDGICIGGLLEWLQEAETPEFHRAFGDILKTRQTRWKLSDYSKKLFNI